MGSWRNRLQRIASAERSYRLLTQNLGEVVCHIADDGRIDFVSPSVRSVLGAPPSHWIGRNIEDIIPPEDLDDHRGRVKRLRAGEVVKERLRITAVDGSAHWVHMFAKPFFHSDGRRDGAAVTFRDIEDAEVSALELAAEARRVKELADENYRRSMEYAVIGMSLVRPDGRFEQVNPALCEFYGYDADTLLTMTWQELTAPDYLEADLINLEDLLRGRRDSYRMVKQYIHADGHPIWGALSVSCVRDGEGRVEHLVSQIIDITEQVRAREQIALRDEQNRLLDQDLQRQTARLTAELESAAAYMSSILPGELTGKVSVSSRYLPARLLGGDSFDYGWIDDDHLVFHLIDVSGHGIRPALLSVSLHNVLRSGSLSSDSLLEPDKVLSELNTLFQMEKHDDHYFTMWYGIYQVSTRTLRYSSAGAPPALAFSSAPGHGFTTTELNTEALPGGLFTDTEFTTKSYVVPPGCRILLYSDGAYELGLGNGRQLALADFIRLSGEVAQAPDWSLDELIGRLRDLASSRSFEDDCSLVQLKFD